MSKEYEKVEGYAKLHIVGVLFDGEFIPKEKMSEYLFGADDHIIPFYCNQMNNTKIVSIIKLDSLQNYVPLGQKMVEENNLS